VYHWWEFEIQCFSCVYECLEIEGNGQQWHHVKQICRMYQRLEWMESALGHFACSMPSFRLEVEVFWD
jgi:hypothetical protein